MKDTSIIISLCIERKKGKVISVLSSSDGIQTFTVSAWGWERWLGNGTCVLICFSRNWTTKYRYKKTHVLRSTGKDTNGYTQNKKRIWEKLPLDPREVNCLCCPPSLLFRQAASTPLGFKLIFMSLVSSPFLHICSKSYYEAFVIWIMLVNWKVFFQQKLDTKVIRTIFFLYNSIISDIAYRKTWLDWWNRMAININIQK